jgi:hypothetical protein
MPEQAILWQLVDARRLAEITRLQAADGAKQPQRNRGWELRLRGLAGGSSPSTVPADDLAVLAGSRFTLRRATAKQYVPLDCSVKQMPGNASHRRLDPILLRVDPT